jgi:SET domain-containing protein
MIHKYIGVLETDGKGKGLFVNAPILKGETVWSKEGLKSNHFSKKELETLDSLYARLAYWDGDYYTIDENDEGNYMNHSCDPNLWWKNDTLVALRDIMTGEEVTYDYATTDIYGINGKGEMVCLCGSVNCRKIVKPNDLLQKSLQLKYSGHWPSYINTWLKDVNKI